MAVAGELKIRHRLRNRLNRLPHHQAQARKAKLVTMFPPAKTNTARGGEFQSTTSNVPL
jgi:hypothetical protein